MNVGGAPVAVDSEHVVITEPVRGSDRPGRT